MLCVLVTVQCHRPIGLTLAWGKLHSGQFSLSFLAIEGSAGTCSLMLSALNAEICLCRFLFDFEVFFGCIVYVYIFCILLSCFSLDLHGRISLLLNRSDQIDCKSGRLCQLFQVSFHSVC